MAAKRSSSNPVNGVVVAIIVVLTVLWFVNPLSIIRFHITYGSKVKSLCSSKADIRGPGQRVISFCIFGHLPLNPRYFNGIEQNVLKVRELYPNYIMRLYFNSQEVTKDSDEFKTLYNIEQSHYGYFDLCDVKDLGNSIPRLSESFGMLWRFAPMADPLVEEFHSRDLDMIVTQREVDAVSDWLSRSYHYHIMRDNPQHVQQILGGMWGVRLDSTLIKAMNAEKFMEMIEASMTRETKHGLDQHLLRDFLWPVVQNDMVAHDSYSCELPSCSSNLTRPWPSRRVNGPNFTDPGVPNFVGGGGRIFLGAPGLYSRPCPKTCRPKDHQDWIFC